MTMHIRKGRSHLGPPSGARVGMPRGRGCEAGEVVDKGGAADERHRVVSGWASYEKQWRFH
ncbi:hypothetical protein BC567DRAFT_236845 [Phyllosticta citribraziliensis]